MDEAVRIERVWETNAFEPGGGIRKQYHYQFRIGGHGPFYESFGAGEHNPDAVQKRLAEKALTLREIGVIKTPEK